MIKYAFKEDHAILKNASKANPQKIGEALAKITAAHSGRLEPENVVKAAKDEKSPLHHHFEWNDRVAAHSYRMDQARNIIRIIRVEDTETGDVQPAYVSVAQGGVSYRAVSEVVNSRELQLIVLQQAERDLRAFQKRYRMLKDICEAIEPVFDALDRQKSQMGESAAAAA